MYKKLLQMKRTIPRFQIYLICFLKKIKIRTSFNSVERNKHLLRNDTQKFY